MSLSQLTQAAFEQLETDAGLNRRQDQLEMAHQVADALIQGQTLFVEAGTGVGKSYAYSIPAILSGQKTIITTATKNLQEQLTQKDLPQLRKWLKHPFKVALLKGRENYFCPKRYEQALMRTDWYAEEVTQLEDIGHWSNQTTSGDKANCTTVDENAPIWSKVCAQQAFCSTQDCHVAGGCFFQKAKEAAKKAQVVVVNHHLFAADMALKQVGFGEVLPEAAHLIIDEAHQLPGVLSQHLGIQISWAMVSRLVEEVESLVLEWAPAQGKQLIAGIKQWQLLGKKWLKQCQPYDGQKITWQQAAQHWQWLLPQMEQTDQLLSDLLQALSDLKEVHESLAAQYAQVQQQHLALTTFMNLVQTLSVTDETLSLEDEDLMSPEPEVTEDEGEKQPIINGMTVDPNDWVAWVEVGRSWRLILTPIQVGQAVQRARNQYDGGWVFASATLTTSNSFVYFQNQIGFFGEERQEAIFNSPFDYPNQAAVIVPTQIDSPKSPHHTQQLMQWCLPLIERNQGHGFLLFTSYRALTEAYDWLSQRLSFPIFKQGDQSRHQLLAEYKKTPSAILMGTSSFWEGVDVKGQQLSLLIIDKIPFTPPDDPVEQARAERAEQLGQNPFIQLSLPKAIMMLKQGVGRLIRHENDEGLVVLGDSRLRQMRYGTTIMNSLPNMRPLFQQQQAVDFVTALRKKMDV